MQSLPFAPVDMMPAAPPAKTATVRTGQDGIFAAHLAAAAQGQAPSPPQTTRLRKEENTSSPSGQRLASNDDSPSSVAGQNPASEEDATAQTTSLKTKKSGDSHAGQKTASEDESQQNDAPGDLTALATLNNAAGATNITLLQATGIADPCTADASNNPSAAPPVLGALTAATNGKSGSAQGVPAGQTQGATTASTANTAAGQPLALETAPSLPAAKSPDAATENTATTTVPGPGNGENAEGTATIRIDATALQPQITVSLAGNTASAAEASRPGQGAAGQSVTVQAPPDATLAADQQTAAQQGADQVVQTAYGQIITIHQSAASDETAAMQAGGGKPLTTRADNQVLDVNNNSIHAHLANDAPQTREKENNSQQQDTAKDNLQKGANAAKSFTAGALQPEAVSPQAAPLTTGSENQSLFFSQQQTNTAVAANTPTADSSTLPSPSASTIPSGTVVDQMIAHFSVNRHLESGTVNLKLTPQELGELRMEIKITQDTVRAHFIAQNPQAQEMIGLHLPRLREALEQQGLHLQQVEVTVASNSNNSNTGREQFQGHAGQQQMHQSRQNRGSQPIFSLDTGGDTADAAQAVNNLSVLA